VRLSRDRLASYFDAYTKRFLRDGSPEAVDVEVTSLPSAISSPRRLA
jgi:hypothetical protein